MQKPAARQALRLSKNRFAGFFFPQNEFCGGLFYLIGSGRPNYGLPRHTPHSRRGSEGPWLRPASRFRQIFAKIWRVTVLFSRHMSMKKHPIRKSLQFYRLFRQAESLPPGRLFLFERASEKKKPRRRSLCAGAKVQGHGRSQSQKELPESPPPPSPCSDGSGSSGSSGASGSSGVSG